MIDLHCHLLPGVDDGPADLAGAIAMAADAYADGTRTIATTPHVKDEFPHNTGPQIEAALAALQPHVDVELVRGGELDALHAVTLTDEELQGFTLGGGPWLLFECPLSPVAAPAFAPAARALARRGHRLLLAHPERSPAIIQNPQLLKELVDEGMLAQVTAGSLTGQYGRTPRELARKLVADGLIHVAASDGHGPHRPATIARELAAAEVPEAQARWLGQEMPAAILAGTALPARPAARRAGRLKQLFTS